MEDKGKVAFYLSGGVPPGEDVYKFGNRWHPSSGHSVGRDMFALLCCVCWSCLLRCYVVCVLFLLLLLLVLAVVLVLVGSFQSFNRMPFVWCAIGG